MTRRMGLTLVELLVSIAILMLLAGLYMSATRAAIVSAQLTQARSDLRQIGMAVLMYREAEGAYPPSRLDPVVQAGYFTTLSMLKVRSDPYTLGYARHVYDCNLDPEDRTSLITSYEDVFTWSEHDHHHIWLEEFIRPIDDDPALIALRVFGTHFERARIDQCHMSQVAFMGRTLRFHEDGSVRTVQFWDGDPGQRNRFCWPALFSNLHPDIVCERTRRPQ